VGEEIPGNSWKMEAGELGMILGRRGNQEDLDF
jgi:hypothetical protein